MSQNGLSDNRSLLAKADLALSDLVSQGGLLQPAQAAKFMRIMIKASRLLGMTTVVPMRSYQQTVEKIKFGSRILHAGTEATALAAADRVKPDFSKATLTAQLFKGEVRLDNEVLEDTIERGELRQTVMQLMAERIALDTEELLVLGDTTSTDPYLAKVNGLISQVTTHTVNAGDTPPTKTLFRDMLKAMPSEYLRDKKALRFLTSVNAEISYRDSLSDRGTVMGDKYTVEDVAALAFGVPVEAVPLFPENIGTGSHCTDVVLIDPKNINVGIWRNIRIETDKLISEGVLLIVATLRMDFVLAEETASVKAYNVKVT